MESREHDRVRRGVATLYASLGPRFLPALTAAAIALGLLTLIVTAVWAGRFLRLSAGRVVLAIALAMPLGAIGLVVAVWRSRRLWEPALRWSGPAPPVERAAETWNEVVGNLDRMILVCCSGALLGGLLGTVIFMLVSGVSLTTGAMMVLAGMVGLLALAALSFFVLDLAMRPMVEDIAAHLPSDFVPTARGWRLRTKALAPLPVVTLFSAFTVGAYLDVVDRGPLRFLFAFGIGLATIAIAGFGFWLVSRSLLDPMDDLLDGMRRVSAGDIQTPVPVVTADELGELAVGFNRMLTDLRRQTEELRTSRERIVAAADEERRRVERDLHDGAQQQLVLMRLKFAMLERHVADDPQASALTDELKADLERALAELRDLARGLYPPLLENDGLRGALGEAAARAALPTTIECDGARRYRPDLEAAVYFCCLEALQNAAKHAGEGATATIRLATDEGTLRFEVSDNGQGFAPNRARSGVGLQNMGDRIGALGGKLEVRSAPGNGTTVIGSIPAPAGARA